MSAVEDGFRSHFQSAGGDICEEWETFKQKVKILAIERSSVLAYQTRRVERNLIADLQALTKTDCQSPGVATKHLESVKKWLKELNEQHCRGAVVRTRSEKYVMGEQPSKRALADEKRYPLRNEIGEIEYQGVTSTNPSFLQRAFVAQYRRLFESQDPARRDLVCGER